MATFNVRLYRDGLQTAWGFRLQGGKDFNQPLTIQRVFTGSPAEGELQRGDIISAIDNYETTSLTHKEAQEVIKRSGGSLILSVKRAQSPVKGPQSPLAMQQGGFRSVKPFSPQSQYGGACPSFGVDYTRGQQYSPARHQPSHMMDRVQQSLDNAIMYPEEEPYEFRPVSELKKGFQSTSPSRAPAQSSGRRWKPPVSVDKPIELGWTPRKAPHRPGYQPPQPEPEPDLNITKPVNSPYDYTSRGGGQGQVIDSGQPAWVGSLRSANSGSAWPAGSTHATLNMQQASSPTRSVPPHHPPQQHHQQQQHLAHNDNPREFAMGATEDAPHAVNMQYNSPINLYSRNNVSQAVQGQFKGTSLKVAGEDGKDELDLNRSYVYRMLQEEQAAKKKPSPKGHHSYAGGHDPHSHSHVPLMTNAGVQDVDYGTSDF